MPCPLSDRYPAVRMQIELGIGPDISALLDEGELDLAIVGNELSHARGKSHPVRGKPPCQTAGLRKASAAIAAENGATEDQLMAIFGWVTSKQAAHYTKGARRRKLAGDGMGLLERHRK